MSSELWFLHEDLDDLQAAIDDVKRQIRDTKLEAQEGTEQSSESWHDNYVFEEAQRQLKMLLTHLGALSNTMERAVIREPDPTDGEVAFGSLITVEVDGRVDEYSIGSAMVFDRMRDRGYISYQSPLAAALLGAHPGETRTAMLGGTTRLVTVIAVNRC